MKTRRPRDAALSTRRVRIAGEDGHRSVVALAPLAVGDVVLVVTGELTSKPSRYSVQVGEFEHVDLPSGLASPRVLDEYPWQFLNHSCAPNVRLVGRQFLATQAIRAGDAITFDYNTTEYEMATPFDCRCGATTCHGRRIAGFRHLSPAEQKALLPLLSDALRARVAREPGLTRVANRG